MPPRIDDERRAAIIADIEAGTKSARQIAKDHEVSASTVSKIAADEHLDGAFERAQTKKAREALTEDIKAVRATLSAASLSDADALRRRALAAPTAREVRDYATAFAIFVDKHLVLDGYDSDTAGLSDVDAWLDHLTGD